MAAPKSDVLQRPPETLNIFCPLFVLIHSFTYTFAMSVQKKTRNFRSSYIFFYDCHSCRYYCCLLFFCPWFVCFFFFFSLTSLQSCFMYIYLSLSSYSSCRLFPLNRQDVQCSRHTWIATHTHWVLLCWSTMSKLATASYIEREREKL